MSSALSLDTIDIISPEHYEKNGYPHAEWKLLREKAPVWRWDDGRIPGFWAITKYNDLVEISKQPRRFLNEPRLAVSMSSRPTSERQVDPRSLLNMDPPEHGVFRKLTSGRFTPRAMRALEGGIEAISLELLDGLERGGELSEADFVDDFAAPLTLSVLVDMLGVPRKDWRKMFRWTNEMASAEDPEFRKPGEDSAAETGTRATLEMFAYFRELAAERRADPRADMTSVLARAEVDDEPLEELDMLSYFILLVVAGNETTRNAASGGLLALIENPGELQKLRDDPGLINSAVEEIVRWTSPVIQFCRTPVEDVEIRGQKIKAGESLCLFYPSANRDAEIFDEPDRFRIDRDPNPHVGFGIGEHFCLGANLARLELRIMLRTLIPRLAEIELAGPFERVRSSFLGGVKRMPIRYRLRPG